MMEFSKFRESGDLSDITVIVSSKEFKLHKFPLFARSDYFCELARVKTGGDAEALRVELVDFPGGDEIFELVANFCYKMPLNLNKNNVVAVRCAAEYLKMVGPGNLTNVSSKFFMDTISSAKLNRLTSIATSMLMDCNIVGDMADAAGVVDVCLDAFIECWIKPSIKYATLWSGRVFFKAASQSRETFSAFTRLQAPSGQQTTDKLDEFTLNCILSLRPDWFAALLTKAETKGAGFEELGSLAIQYISSVLDLGANSKEKQCSKDANQENVGNKENSIDNDKDIDTNNSGAVDELFASSDHEEKTDAKADIPIRSHVKFDTPTVLDKVILALPDQAFNIPAVTLEWLKKTIPLATLHGCECRTKLARVAGEMLAKLDPKDLCCISPSVIHDIVMDAGDEKNEGTSRLSTERSCRLVDTYMSHMAKEGTLTSETFHLLASATKNYARPSHDLLFTVLEFVIKSEKDKLTPEQINELTDFVNFDQLSEVNLQKALDEEMVSPNKIAHSAIQLCARLRSELASVKYIAEMQEEDIQQFRKSATPEPITKTTHSGNASTRHLPVFPSGQRNTNSEPAEHDENLDLSSLEVAEDADSSYKYPSTDPFKAAQQVLSTARHRLNLPVYTGYRPLLLSSLSARMPGGHSYNHATQRDYEISFDDELEFQLDRSFQSLDTRGHHLRPITHQYRTNADSGQRTYFPYSTHSRRF